MTETNKTIPFSVFY